jgi:hypothetical protein
MWAEVSTTKVSKKGFSAPGEAGEAEAMLAGTERNVLPLRMPRDLRPLLWVLRAGSGLMGGGGEPVWAAHQAVVP